jgi:hypothetical protein
MAIEESFDIGIDTRTGVDDSYKLPFQFTGKIDNEIGSKADVTSHCARSVPVEAAC